MAGSVAELRHEARGYMNAVRLCSTALGLSDTVAEDVAFLQAIIAACDDLSRVMEQLETDSGTPSNEAGSS